MAMNKTATDVLEEQYAEAAATAMAREIDREILWGMLVSMGWVRVALTSETAMVNATLIKEWLEANCANPHEKHRGDFIFEDKKDAVNFILRWK